LLIPVGGFYTIDSRTAFELAKKVGAAVTIPMHYKGEGFGFEVISTVDEYAALAGNAEFADSNEIMLDGELGEGRTVVLKCPVG
ncbi:MAG: Zn-dependent hydrolase, partial [Oscillospiraceae bacterium]|nr:Zn-dependent hydrolase [Oscillospiraceae bacterium]